MSIYSGKCDFYDGFVAIRCDGDEQKIKEKLKKLTLYVRGKDGRDHLVKSDTLKDISKYFPYLESMVITDGDTMACHLSSDSFIDQEERESRNLYANRILRYWKKCKRKKIPFIEEDCKKELWFPDNKELEEMIHRVALNGKNAEFEDIHFPSWEWNRRRWFEAMVELGWSEQEAYNWCFKGLFDPPEVEEKRLGRQVKRG